MSINVAISADGKISTRRRESFPLGSASDRYLMDVLRARSDAVIIGARTLRLDGWPIRVRDRALREKRLAQGKSPHPLNVALSTTLDVPLTAKFFQHSRTERLLFTTRQAPAQRVARFRRVGDVVVLPAKRVHPARVLDELARRGARRVLLEGGGELNFSFFEAGLVDDLYVTVTPRILGGRDAPTAVDGHGFLQASHPGLHLVSCRRDGQEVFLRYRVTNR